MWSNKNFYQQLRKDTTSKSQRSSLLLTHAITITPALLCEMPCGPHKCQRTTDTTGHNQRPFLAQNSTDTCLQHPSYYNRYRSPPPPLHPRPLLDNPANFLTILPTTRLCLSCSQARGVCRSAPSCSCISTWHHGWQLTAQNCCCVQPIQTFSHDQQPNRLWPGTGKVPNMHEPQQPQQDMRTAPGRPNQPCTMETLPS